MRRLLFFLSCGVLAWALVFGIPERRDERTVAVAPEFEDRVVAMVHAREVVGRRTTRAIEEGVETAKAARDRVAALADRLSLPD